MYSLVHPAVLGNRLGCSAALLETAMRRDGAVVPYRLMQSDAASIRRFADAARHGRLAITVAALCTLVGCRSRPTQVELLLDSNIDRDRLMSLTLAVVEGAQPVDRVRAAQGMVTRISNGERALFPSSITLVPKTGSVRTGVVSVLVELSVQGTASSPPLRIERFQRVTLIERSPQQGRIFFNVDCAGRSTGCRSVADDQCTIAQRCIDQGLTCGDEGRCVPVDLPTVLVPPEVPLDASVLDDRRGFDATGDIASDTIDDRDATSMTNEDAADVASDLGTVEDVTLVDASDDASMRDSGIDVQDARTDVQADAQDARTDAQDARTDAQDARADVPSDTGVAPINAPRPILPGSTSTVTSQRPSLRWSLAAGTDGADVQLCRNRAMTASCAAMLSAAGTTIRPGSALASGVWFWRLRGRLGAAAGTTWSPVWQFRVGARSAASDRDRSWGAELDVNGDGFADAIAGSQDAESARGRVELYYGSATGLAATASVTLRGANPGDRFGSSIASAGDVNGDGFGDLIVGAHFASPGGRTRAGTTSVFLGSATGISTTPSVVLDGVIVDDQFGGSVSSAGDVNADGYADIVVGAAPADSMTLANVGSASIFVGSATGIVSMPQRVLYGVAQPDGFGFSVASAGDINGDGFADVVVGAPYAQRAGREGTGVATVFLGSATGLVATPHRSYEGTGTDENLGASVAGIGDVNGDGFADVAIGSPSATPPGRGLAGIVQVFHGATTGLSSLAASTFEGATDDQFGWAVEGAGDVDGDGFADMIVGSIGANPGGRLDAGSASVFVGSMSGLSAAPRFVLEGIASGDQLGCAVSGPGDVNGDRFSDLLVGACQADPGGRNSAGAATMFLGMPVGPTRHRTIDGPTANERFGSSLGRSGL